jgi:prepilin-type N-terminal cleavage/methylation domain-containing protein
MKTNQKGFGALEVLIVIVIISVLGLAGWYVWKIRNPKSASTNSSTTVKPTKQSEAYKRATTVPAGWKTFTDSKYPISFSYPSSWTTKADSKGNPDKCDYEIGAGASQQTYDVMFCINEKESLDAEATTLRKTYRTEGAGYSKLLSEKTLTIDGHAAIEFRSQQIGNAPGQTLGPVWKQYLVSAGGNVYRLPAVSESDAPGVMPAQESLALFESITIK